MSEIRVPVCRRHWLKGKQCDDDSCALALAMQDAGLAGVSVCEDQIRFVKDHVAVIVSPNAFTASLIELFDRDYSARRIMPIGVLVLDEAHDEARFEAA